MKLKQFTLLIASLVSIVSPAARFAAAADDDKAGIEFFEKKIRPVLVKHCYECHSAESDEVKGNLRVDTREAIRKGGDNGEAVVPGKPDESFLLRVIRYEEDDYQMPPDGKLPDEVTADFEKWIEMGAPDPREETSDDQSSTLPGIDLEAGRQFWAFRPPSQVTVPDVKDGHWPRDDVDRFVLANLEKAGIKPVDDAAPERLLRRVYFDLIGLPPSVDDLTAFLTAIRGRESAQVEGALAAVVDRLLASPRFGERWGRHWLDLARYADSNGLDQNLTHYEAWRYRDYVVDAFNRDKPYDQFILEQLAGDLLPYENDQQQAEQLIATGFLMVGPKQLSERDKEKLRMDVVDEQIDTMGKVFLGMTLGCARCHDHKFDPIPTRDYYALAGIFRSTTTVDGIKLGNVFVSGWKVRPLPIEPAHAAALARHAELLAAIESPLKEARDALKQIDGPATNPRKAADLPGIMIDDIDAEIVGDWKHSTHSTNYVGSGYMHDDRQGKGEKSATFRTKLPESGRYEVRISFAGSNGRSRHVPVTVKHADGEDRIELDQTRPAKIESLFESLGTFAFESGNDAVVTVETTGTEDGYVIADAVQFLYAEAASNAEVVAAEPPSPDKASRREELQNRVKQLEAELAELKTNEPAPAPRAMAAEDVAHPADYHQLIRGNHNRLGDVVPRGFLSVAMPGDRARTEIAPNQSGRLELARWIASAENPLTARVMVNRVWHYLMGEGLVRSMDNFGKLGDQPSHPELLDYLALRFVEHDWSVKEIVRTIVLSRTYRLAAHHDEAAFAVDPENRLRWRYPRRRLDAECIRDAMLAISGQLDLTTSGTMVANLPEQAFNNDGASPIDYDVIPRRSVFLPILRSDVPSILAAFDFADPEMVTGERAVTTVPTQALLMMNSPFVRRQALDAARRLLADDSLTDSERVDQFYQLAFTRLPTDEERAAALAYVETMPDDLAGTVDHATKGWASFCQAMLAATEFRFVD